MEYWRVLVKGTAQRIQRAWSHLRSRSEAPQMSVEEMWRISLEEGPTQEHRHIVGLIPSETRCKLCHAPFDGLGGVIFRLLGSSRSSMNPSWCKGCMENSPAGGAEVELSLLFMDVRGSTTLAEDLSSAAYARLLNRFYSTATTVLVQSDALIDKFVGDEVIALYVPGFAGEHHPKRAIQAAHDLMLATGHSDTGGPWIPVGIGVHTGKAFVGKMGEGGVTDITALGDTVNTAARLTAKAKTGEIVISEDAYTASGASFDNAEQRSLQLKGKSEPVAVRVLKTGLLSVDAP